MSTRTPIHFGSMLLSFFKERMPQYELAFQDTSNKFLLFGFRKSISSVYHSFILIQAYRKQGRMGVEAAISRNGIFPYHRFSDLPDLGVAGYREPIYTLLKGFNHGDDYQSAEGLLKIFLNVSRDADQAVGRLVEKAIPRIKAHYERWEPLYLEWLEAERHATGAPGSRYPGLGSEAFALELLENTLTSGQFDRYLGPLKYRYRANTYFHCHLYLLARALEFIELPSEQPSLIVQVPKGPMSEPAEDPIASMTGRFPQDLAVELSTGTSERVTEYAFLKSLAAVEAFYQLDEAGLPAADILLQHHSPSSSPFSIDAPAYSSDIRPVESRLIDLNPNAHEPVAAPVEQPEEEDPIAALEARFGIR